MKRAMLPFTSRRHADGFILVTSLIFLVVITLLAISAINSATLQERMASNLREKSRARQAADAALRHAELLLRDPMFDELQAPGTTVTLTPADHEKNDNVTASLKLFDSDTHDFLKPAFWQGSSTLPFVIDPKISEVRFYVEDYGCMRNTAAPDPKCEGGTMLYRITARAQGENTAAIAVTQSLYGRRY